MTITIGPYVAGEVPEPLEYVFLDPDGNPIDLTGFAATFVLQLGAAASATLAASVTDAAAGTVSHTWLDGELTAGALYAEFWVDNGTNRYASERFSGRALPAL